MSPLVHSLLALTTLLSAVNCGHEQVLFGINTPRFIRLTEVTLSKEGGFIKVKNYCPSAQPKGAQVVARNSYYDRAPHIDGTILNPIVTCRTLGPYTTCKNSIKVNITLFC